MNQLTNESQKLRTEDIQNIEIDLLLEAIYLKYGYDFRSYSRASIKRRISATLSSFRLTKLSDLQHKILYEENAFNQLLLNLSINVTEMFRDPEFYRAVRQKVIPILKTYPFIKLWHAGCSTGEEVYSLAILLREEGLTGKFQIYATDFNELVLKKAKQGIFPLDRIKEYTLNYQKAGGLESFADYYSAHYDHAIIHESLKKNIVFADHNLATDGAFGEMNMIMCRNVLIYFNRDLQNRAIGLFYESLSHFGFLCLGTKEDISFTQYANKFEILASKEKIFRKRG
ncbi:MAG: protein-glutamate O-methyltransferase CheR [Candidatus Aminicenantes bacterium]|nr:protein-glutamate O-methyltransferase CheR [Candidatus Aminicenantes bacterium]